MGDRPYTGDRHGGFAILDISNTAEPKFVSGMVDITDQTNPAPFSTFRVDGGHGSEIWTRHQPADDVTGTGSPVAWFDCGPRLVDISDPHAMRQVAYDVPDPQSSGDGTVRSNGVRRDDRGPIPVIERWGGLGIVERT